MFAFDLLRRTNERRHFMSPGQGEINDLRSSVAGGTKDEKLHSSCLHPYRPDTSSVCDRSRKSNREPQAASVGAPASPDSSQRKLCGCALRGYPVSKPSTAVH